MSITPEIEAQILRYYHVERWRIGTIGTIATQLNVHRDSVARVLAQADLPALGGLSRPSAIDPYLPFILETLEQFPRLRASRLYDMVRTRGYPGRPDHLRHLIARHRPRRKAEAYLRLRTLPGEQMQVDWGLCRVPDYAEFSPECFGSLQIKANNYFWQADDSA